jgi:hypothetical protein
MEVEILVKKFKSTFALTAILMVTVLLAGCFGSGTGTKTFTLTVNVVPEGAAEVKDLAKKYDKDSIAEFALEAAEGYEFVEWTGDDKPVYNDEDEVWEIVMDGDKTLTAVFKEIEEEPVDPEPVADEEAAAAVDAQIMALDKEVGLDQYKIDVAAARAAYEALNAETKALVTKLVFLEAHEDQLDELLYGEVTEFVIAEKVMDGIDLTADVLEDITLGSNFTYDGTVYQVTWESDKPEIITADGTVNRPYGEDVEVTLTATLDFIGTLSADQKNVFEIKLNVVGIRFDLAVENGSVTATLNDLTGLDAVTADDFAITFAIADEAVEAEDLKVEYKDGVATWTFTPFERGLEDYKVDIAVTFGEFEEKDSLEFVGLAVIVETVDAIDTGKVEVTITASDVDRFAQTVEVLDNKGNEVKVKAVDIPAGETKLVFEFEDTIEKQEGVWTIGGVEYDFDEYAAVKAVKYATNLVELWEALQSDYFTGAVEENIVAYNEADKSELVTAEDVNKMIADVNKALTDAETVVKPVVDAANELELLRALQNGGFADVDSKLSYKYYAAINGTVDMDSTVEEIQDIINRVNDQAAADAVVALIDELPEEITLKDKADVVAARAAYDALTEDQQELVPAEKVATLEAAEDAIEAAEDAASLQALVKAAEEAIEALPEEITLEHKAIVENARALVDAAQELDAEVTISNIAILEAAETAITNARIAAGLVENAEELALALANEEVETITLANGNYGDVTISREVELVAENKHKAVLGEVTIRSDDVTVDGVTAEYIDFYDVEDITITNNVVTGNRFSVAIGGAGGRGNGAATITGNQVLNGAIGLYATKTFDNYTITGNTIEKASAEGIWLAYFGDYSDMITLGEADSIADQLVAENTFGAAFDAEDAEISKVKVATNLFDRIR